VPVIFTYVDGAQHWIGGRLLKGVHQRQAAEKVEVEGRS
jgi:hypothetical protein